MEMNARNIEQIVQQVLSEMNGTPGQDHTPGPSTSRTPRTGRVAMLTAKERFELQTHPIPPIGDNEILVKVEGCGVCGTDAHEYKNDPFGLIPLVLGHEGSGEVVQVGKNVTKDSAGKPVAVGDKVVTSVMFGEDEDIVMMDMNKQNISDKAQVYGLLPDDSIHFNGWFGDYLILREKSSFFVVNDLSLDLRLLVEPSAVVVHAVERAKSTQIMRFDSKVVVQGCGPIGLLLIAVLRTMGIEHIIAIDGEEQRLAFAKELGATQTINITKHQGLAQTIEAVEAATGGKLADFAFQCTGSPGAHAAIWNFVRRGGGLCELGFFVNNGEATINPHLDICKKEITVVGSWVYTLRDYGTTFDFLKRAKGIGLPIEQLITHKFPLEQINEALTKNLQMQGLKIAIVNG